MRTILIAVLLVAVLAACATGAHAAERIRIAVMTPTGKVGTLGELNVGEYVHAAMVDGMAKVERFDQMSVGDLQLAVEQNALQPQDMTVANAANLAARLKVRLVLFVDVRKASLDTEVEDKVLIQTTVVVARACIEGTLFDAKTGQTTTIGPYEEEERASGSEGGTGRFEITPEKKEKLTKAALDSAAKQIRSKMYKLYPLAGAVSAARDGVVILDIGTAMGVAAEQKYTVFGMVERDNPVTGLKETVRDEVALLEVTAVAQNTATCKVVRGEQNPRIGAEVERNLRE